MLERRRAQLLERLVHLRARVKAGRDRADSYARSLMEHDRESAEHDLSWIERLIASERSDRSDRPDTPRRAGLPPLADRPQPEPPAVRYEAASPSLEGLRPVTSQEDTSR
jgi:hypothetical protein